MLKAMIKDLLLVLIQLLTKMLNFLKGMLFVFPILFPSLLSVPTKSRESGGILIGAEKYQKELTCLERALWHEARGESEEGIRAVMSVIYNRKNHKNYPNTFCKVILQDKQFSAFNENKDLARKHLKPLREHDKIAYTKVSGIAQEAVQGTFEPVLEPSVLHYAHVKVKNKWTRKFTRVIVLGNHSFYKEI